MFQPRRNITILGQEYALACTLRALARFEMRTGLTLADVSADATPGTIRALLWALLITEHPDMEERTVGCTSDLLGAFETALLLIADSLPRVDPDPEAETGERSKWMDMWAVARLEQDARDLRRRLKELDEARLDREAVELAAGAVSAGAFRLVSVRRAVESPEELKGLAGRLRLNVGLVALVAGTTPDGRAHLVLARSDDVPADMNEILRGILPLVEGKGGGRPEMAQGSGTAVARLDEALGQAVRALQRAESD